MAPYTPPTTGVGGVASSVVANMYDHSGYFRGRSFSPKRRRTDGGFEGVDDRYARYDITKDYPPSSCPPPPQIIDINAVNALLVDASKEVAELEKADGDGKLTQKQHSKVQTKSIFTLFKLLETIVEKAVIPWAEAGSPRIPPRGGGDCGPPPESAKVKALREALEVADKTVVIFDANLGPVSVANCSALAHNLTTGLRAAAIDVAANNPDEAVEGVRLASDALSCVVKVEFLGQSSRKAKPILTADDDGDERAVEQSFCTMPVRLEFEDRSGRLHFQRTMRYKCGLKASMSLPFGVRVAQKAAHTELKQEYPGMIVMVRPKVESLSFVALIKNDGEKKWTILPNKLPIDPNCLSWTGRQDAAAAGAAATVAALQDG